MSNNIINAFSEVIGLVQQATQYIIATNPITSLWFALIVILCIGCFLVGKILNRDG